ncbi:unnamed protein product [Acanthoscelides obtectus]|uniref:Uncharacterized protein n=1 Tax=Acanthoscelides obtectus TaxID=200917 RepID=A0A9P0PLA0_ACAOB|nr:unnamed protein product [Acanthoscelides obtectus]CAK1671505.1 hypothetical protein AOBTE_LOCUS28281 [Acanthoscelides obtectus]
MQIDALECIYAQPKNVLFIHEGKKYIDIQLNRTCQSADGFNRTLIELQCETDIENNEHFVNRKEWRIKNCILYVPFVTSKACRNEDQSGVHKIEQPQYSIGDVDIVHDPPKEQAKERDVTVSHTDILYNEQNCTKFIKNNYTGYTFNISTLNFQVKVIGCPSIAFNYSNNSVSIQNDCDKMVVNQPEACKLLEKAPVSAAYSAAAVAGLCGLLTETRLNIHASIFIYSLFKTNMFHFLFLNISAN